MRVIAIANQKGGVGKTTIALALATATAYIARQRTLLVDLDTQANATLGLMQRPAPGVADWLMMGRPLKSVVIHVRGLLDLVPSNSLTEETNLALANRGRIDAVKKGLNGADYDYVFVDCPPRLSMIARAGLYGANYILTPVDCETFAVAGLALLSKVIQEVQEANSRARWLAVVPNKYRPVNLHNRSVRKLIEQFGKGMVWPALPLTVQIPAAQELGQSVWECPEVDKRHKAAWAAFVQEVLSYG